MAKQRISLLDQTPEQRRETLSRTADILQGGGVIIFPTETVYGIGVAATCADGLANLRRIKQRSPDKPFQFLVNDIGMAKRFGAVFSTKAESLALNYWPGPLTMVVPDGTNTDGTYGIRVPDTPFLWELCELIEQPLIASSANLPDMPPPLTADQADVFGTNVDILLDGGVIADGVPSTVVECTGDEYAILRHGAIDAADIESAWNE